MSTVTIEPWPALMSRETAVRYLDGSKIALQTLEDLGLQPTLDGKKKRYWKKEIDAHIGKAHLQRGKEAR